EQREERSAEAPGPQPLAVFLVPGFIDVGPCLPWQCGQQFFVGAVEAAGYLGADLTKLPATDLDSQHVPEIILDRGKRAMTGSLEIADQSSEPWTSQPSLP